MLCLRSSEPRRTGSVGQVENKVSPLELRSRCASSGRPSSILGPQLIDPSANPIRQLSSSLGPLFQVLFHFLLPAEHYPHVPAEAFIMRPEGEESWSTLTMARTTTTTNNNNHHQQQQQTPTSKTRKRPPVQSAPRVDSLCAPLIVATLPPKGYCSGRRTRWPRARPPCLVGLREVVGGASLLSPRVGGERSAHAPLNSLACCRRQDTPPALGRATVAEDERKRRTKKREEEKESEQKFCKIWAANSELQLASKEMSACCYLNGRASAK